MANHFFTAIVAPNSQFEGMQWLVLHFMWIICPSERQFLFVNITTEVEMSFVADYDLWYEIIPFLHQIQQNTYDI